MFVTVLAKSHHVQAPNEGGGYGVGGGGGDWQQGWG
jgi:hypothetical protein